jgi:CMP/dCMP kinase
VKKGLIVTIDGPSGAGKSTAAKMLASTMGYRYIDTGAMYRGVAYACSRQEEEGDLSLFLSHLSLSFSFDSGTKVFLDGEDISEKIRDPEISMLASSLSKDGRVRAYLLEIQRQMGSEGGVVLEGRDTGSVVFPEAQVKFYLDASLAERAKRRHMELVSVKGEEELEKVQQEMEKRDREDSRRPLSPLVIPREAIYIDTTGLDAEEVARVMSEHVERVRKGT